MMSNSLPEKQTEGIRLQKVLAAAGLGSRRACEELMDEVRRGWRRKDLVEAFIMVRDEEVPA